MVKNYFNKIIRKIIRILLRKNHTGESIPGFVDPHSINSYSQYQEDLIIDSYFKNKLKGSYVDIGAYDPNDLSNTKKFYLRGWSGINIDPNLSAIENFNQERDRDINLNIGISLIEGKEVFYEMNHKTFLLSIF